MKAALLQYLERYACPEACVAEQLGHYSSALVVPAYDETPGFEVGFEAALRAAPERALLIVVLNAAQDRPVDSERARSMLTHWQARGHLEPAAGRRLSEQPPIWLLRRAAYDVLCVDRMSQPFRLPAKQGVGLARKLGCDIALGLFARGRLQDPFVHCTDADATLSPNYFRPAPLRAADEGPLAAEQHTRASKAPAAQLSSFEHIAAGKAEASCDASEPAAPKPENVSESPDAVWQATLWYEAALRYHVLSLAHAGSPYAFHTIGSTISVHAEAYAAVRGFPRRTSGEDFYLLNKLAKVGLIVSVPERLVQLRSRLSQRTEHGTGAIVHRHVQRGAGPEVLHPKAFRLLRAWLLTLTRLAEGTPLSSCRDSLRRALSADAEVVWSYLEESRELSAVRDGLGQAREASTRLRRAHERFDAFRTLKFLHAMRDKGHANLPLLDALAESQWWRADPSAASPTYAAESKERDPRALCGELARLETAVVRSWGVARVALR